MDRHDVLVEIEHLLVFGQVLVQPVDRTGALELCRAWHQERKNQLIVWEALEQTNVAVSSERPRVTVGPLVRYDQLEDLLLYAKQIQWKAVLPEDRLLVVVEKAQPVVVLAKNFFEACARNKETLDIREQLEGVRLDSLQVR